MEGDFTTLGAAGGAGNFIGQLPEVRPLKLEVAGSPLVGSTISFDTSDMPSGFSLGLTLVDTVVTSPVPLTPLGASPGTVSYLPVTTSLLFGLDPGNLSIPLPLPNNPAFTGLELYGQSFWFDMPPIGTFWPNPIANLIGSNAMRVKIGNF